MTPREYKQMMDYLTRSGVKDQVKFASDIDQPVDKFEVQQIKLFNEFNKRNPQADGGRIGFRKGGFEKMNLERRLNAYNELKKTYGKKTIEEAFKDQFGTSFEKIAGKKEYKGRTVTNIIDGFKKKIKGVNRSSVTSPIYNEKTGHIYKTSNRFGTFYSKNPGRNQYAPMRSLEEVQKAIDNAPPIEIDGKLFEQNKKDLRGDSEFSGKEVVTRKEQDKYGDKLKYKSAGKKRIVPVTQAYYDRRARELAKSNPTILKKLSGKGGYQLSHLSLSELDTLKNLGYLPAEINLKQYFPFEKKIVEISQQIYETQNNKKLSTQEKRDKIAELQRKDRALRKQFPEFAKTKARLNVRATGLDPSGLMIKEKLPDPSIAIAPTEAGTQLKGTAVGSEKGKALLEMGKNNLQRLAVIGCGIKGNKTGGRIGFYEGQNLQACALRGVEKLRGDPGKLTPGDQANLRAISKSAKAARLLKNVLGPAAIAGEVLIEGGIAANKFMSEGLPIKQALGQSYLNYLLGPKTKIDVEAERAKEFAKGEDFAMAERGRRMAPFMAQSATADAQRQKERMEQMASLYPQYSDQQLISMIEDRGFNPQDIINQKTTTRITPAVTSTLTGLDQLRTAFQEQDALQRIADAGGVANLASGGRAGFSSGTGGYDKPSHRQYLKQMETDLHKHFKRYKRIYGGKMKFNQFAPKFIKEYADGGIASLSGGDKSGPPPERGPNSQGLPGLLKRVRNL